MSPHVSFKRSNLNACSQWLGRLWWRLNYAQPIQATLSRWGRQDDYLAWFNTVSSPVTRTAAAKWQFCERTPSMVGPQAFVFFGVERVLSDNRGWHWKPWGEQWLHNLHAFDDLVASDSAMRYDWHQKMLTNWMVANPPGKGIGWRPESASRRIVNWIKWDLAKGGLNEVSRRNLVVQARFLRQHIGSSLNSGYPTRAGKALLMAGAFFEGTEGDAWRRTGLSLLRNASRPSAVDEFVSQGNSFSISMAEDFLDLLQLGRLYPGLVSSDDAARWEALATQLLVQIPQARRTVPVGSSSPSVLFCEPSVDDLRQYAQQLGLKIL